MSWFRTPLGGWAPPQPTWAAPSGCVVTPAIPTVSFGFGRLSIAVLGVVGTVAGLGWLWFMGHEVEVATNVLATILVATAAALFDCGATVVRSRVAARHRPGQVDGVA